MKQMYVAVVVCAAVLRSVTPAMAQPPGAQAPPGAAAGQAPADAAVVQALPGAAAAPAPPDAVVPQAPSTPALVSPPQAPAETAPEIDRPLTRLLPNLLSDLRRLPSISTAVTLGLGGAVSLVARPNDDHLTKHASAGGTDDVFALGGRLGTGYMQVGGALATYALGRVTKSPKMAHVGSDLIRAQVLTGVLTHGIKLSVRRHRPAGESGSYSFPSGHASASFASATVLWRHFGWKVGIPASLVASYSAGARLQENQHFMSDIAFGAALGIVGGRTVTMGHRGPKLLLTPAPLPGGGGLFVTVLDR